MERPPAGFPIMAESQAVPASPAGMFACGRDAESDATTSKPSMIFLFLAMMQPHLPFRTQRSCSVVQAMPPRSSLTSKLLLAACLAEEGHNTCTATTIHINLGIQVCE